MQAVVRLKYILANRALLRASLWHSVFHVCSGRCFRFSNALYIVGFKKGSSVQAENPLRLRCNDSWHDETLTPIALQRHLAR